jgi:hypothetical protein
MTTLQPGQSVNLSVTVACAAGVPSGSVSFTAGARALGASPLLAGTTQATASFTALASQLTAGLNTIAARFSGNAVCAASSATTSIMLNNPAEGSVVNVIVSPSTVFEQTGGVWKYTIALNESNGGAATLTGYKVNGTPSSQITNFGGTQIPPFGVLQGAFTQTGLTPPVVVTLEIDGTDINGPWSKQVPVTFLGFSGQASLQLTATPSAVMKNSASSSCAWSLQLALRETAGVPLTLTQFLAPFGNDLSANLQTYWNSPCPNSTAVCVAANAQLTATVCFSGLDGFVPTLMDYVLSGTDANSNAVSAAIQVPYLAAPASPNTLAVSSKSLTLSGSPMLLSITAPNSSQIWTASFASGAIPTWLSVSPLSGVGSGTMVLSATAGTLAAGTYTDTMVIQSLDAVPQFATVALSFTVK